MWSTWALDVLWPQVHSLLDRAQPSLPVKDQLDLQLQVSFSQSSTPNVCGPTKDPAVLTDRLVRRVGLFLAAPIQSSRFPLLARGPSCAKAVRGVQEMPLAPSIAQGRLRRGRLVTSVPSSNRALAPFGLRGADRMAPE